MTYFQAIVLGIVQGITEFLPVSSSGHLILVPQLFGWDDQGLAFDTVVHVGTLVAVLIYFRSDIIRLVKAVFIKRYRTPADVFLLWALIFGTIPAVILGFLLKDLVETTLRSPYIVAVGLLVWGIVLYAGDRYHDNKVREERALDQITWKDAIFIGCAQAIALIPGTSRSGITITAGLFRKFSREEAIRFSFLLSIPVIAGAGLLTVLDLMEASDPVNISILITGLISSIVGGLIAILTILQMVKRWKFTPFVVYRVILAIVLVMVIS